ncbi:MAG TPA: hypothetical protein VFP84_08565 [Kofleriaceae bacterium]|nr:hypothetical protein [Kofleriaceae bacterium]
MMVAACATNEPFSDESVSDMQQALSSEGPFSSKQDLINYWAAASKSNTTQIYLNGRKAYEFLGFGPAFVKQYFTCSSQIYAVCPTGFFDGFENLATLVSRSPTTATIYKDSTLYRTGNPNEKEFIATCFGDQSFYGAVRYFKVTSYSTRFGPPFISDCYP